MHFKLRFYRYIPMIIGGVFIAALVAFLLGLVVMYLWNWLMPAIFGLPVISYWQAWGLVLLSHILFRAGHHHSHDDDDDHGSSWKRKFRKRMKMRFEVETPSSASSAKEASDDSSDEEKRPQDEPPPQEGA